MSKHETEWTRHYWETKWKEEGGTLIEEFPAVRPRGRNSPFGKRNLDGVIVLDKQGKHITEKDGLKVNGEILRPPKNGSLHEVKIEGREIIIVQTKMKDGGRLYRLGMYLLGQALFSKDLMEPFQPKDIQSVAVCSKHDTVMEKLARKYEIDVYVPRLHTPQS